MGHVGIMSVKVNKYSISVHIHSSTGYLQGASGGAEDVCVRVHVCSVPLGLRLDSGVHKFRDFQHCGINVHTHARNRRTCEDFPLASIQSLIL